MESNAYTSLDAITTLIHALDYVAAEYQAWMVNPLGVADEMTSWYLAPQQFFIDHISEHFIK